jgi:alpha-amylase/alpha-mannosidase (GH57 family)
MTKPIALLLGVHAHQPVGNFPEVLHDAHLRCYRPYLQTLHRFPEFHFAVHFSGWLLDWLFEHYPADMALLREMVQRGQAELFGAGDTEPVLAVIPYRDRVGQIETLSAKLEKNLGQRPDGAWLTERVWEATVVPALADSGIRYVTVDDYHFLCAGKSAEELDGYFTTEEDGRRLDLFPISEALRYRFPFSPANEAVAYLESQADAGCEAAIYFDDIEKFGIWPETYEWVYEKKWLEEFIRGVLASPKIRPMRYCDFHGSAKTHGIIYLPTTSYIEMNEWSLPAEQANAYADLVRQNKDSGQFERNKAFLRGGIWKNFLTRYPEANWMHKRMLGLSQRLHALPERKRTPEMTTLLYQAQANDAYWHGLFGGSYLPHLRRAVYNAMVALEALLDRYAPRPPVARLDFDLDGNEEAFLQNGVLQAIVRLDGLAAIEELDTYALNHNFGDTLTRQNEHYYRKIHMQDGRAGPDGAGIASPHDRVSFKHEIGPEDLTIDSRPRALFLDTYQPESGAPLELADYEARGGSERGLVFASSVSPVEKTVELAGNRLSVIYRFASKTPGTFTTEINLAMPSCDGTAGKFIFRGEIPGGFGQLLEIDGMKEIVLDDDVLGGAIKLTVGKPVHFHASPYFSVSQSEAGFEKIMQAVTLTLRWHVPIARSEMRIELEIDRKKS